MILLGFVQPALFFVEHEGQNTVTDMMVNVAFYAYTFVEIERFNMLEGELLP